MNTIRLAIRAAVRSQAEDQYVARKEWILNILLLGYTAVSVLAGTVLLINQIRLGDEFTGVSFTVPIFVTLFLLALLYASKKGYSKVAAYIFAVLLVLPTVFMFVTRGPLVPQALLLAALAVTIVGIVLSGMRAFILSAVLGIAMFFLTMFQDSLDTSLWFPEEPDGGSIIVAGGTLALIALVSWVANREIFKLLLRLRGSEKALKMERDLLEVKVAERTNQLQRAQMEKMSQVYRFAEFGRVSSGVMHDLRTPLTVISSTLQQLDSSKKGSGVDEIKDQLQRALRSAKKMDDFIQSAMNQVRESDTKATFSVAKEITQIISIVRSYALQSGIDIEFEHEDEEYNVYGDNTKLDQSILNLLTNAIDAYESIHEDRSIIQVGLKRENENINITVEDWGAGIAEEDLSKIFEPLFTTKQTKKALGGNGIGLSMTKKIIEEHFGGSIHCASSKGKGTLFTIVLPAATQ